MAANPLISVVILSYNSSKTILETLDSIKAQTYSPIELIVADDGSPDNSAQVCREWMSVNADRFERCELLAAEKNTGISSNANRGCRAARGTWLKVLAADDMLLPDACSTLCDFIQENPQSDIVIGKVQPFGDATSAREWLWHDPAVLLTQLTPRQRSLQLLHYNFLPAASAFIKRQCYEELGGFEESIPLMEDWPFWIKASCRNKCFTYLNHFTAKYRFCQTSVSQNGIQDKASRYAKTQAQAEAFANNYLRKYFFGVWLYELSKEKSRTSVLWWIIYKLKILNPSYYFAQKHAKTYQQLLQQHLAVNRKLIDEFMPLP